MDRFKLCFLSFGILILLSMNGCVGDSTENASSENNPLGNSGPTPSPTVTPKPTATPAPTIKPTSTPSVTPKPTSTPISTTTPNPSITPTASPTPTTPPQYDLTVGKNNYNSKCMACHGSTGTGGPGGSLKISQCTVCGDLIKLTNYIAKYMPSPGACVGNCSSTTAAYIFNDFKIAVATPTPAPTSSPTPKPSSTPTPSSTPIPSTVPTTVPTAVPTLPPVSSSYSLSNIVALTPESTLRKATTLLYGRLPTSNELAPIVSQGASGLETALETMGNNSEFSARIGDFYNAEFHWDSPAVRDVIVYDGIGIEWWGTNAGDRNKTWRALRYAGKSLVEYTVKNNLPITNILTADYMMVNPYSARTFNVYEKLGFTSNDENDWRKVTITERWNYNTLKWEGFPISANSDGSFGHAGLLTDSYWLEANPYTATNLNRARARATYKNFLDFDVMTISGDRNISDADPVVSEPTKNNPNCSICHSYVDPIAATFLQRGNRSDYFPNKSLNNINLYPAGIKLSASFSEVYGDTDNEKIQNPLRWLAQQLLRDPRFARAQVNIIYRGLMGKDIIRSPLDPAFASQEQILNSIAQQLKTNNYNIKIAVKEIIKSKLFRAKEISTQADQSLYANTGTVRLIDIETLNKKVKDLLGKEWTRYHTTYNILLTLTGLYGAPEISEPGDTSPASATNASIQEKMALDMSCYIVPEDFFLPDLNSRKLMKKVTVTQVPLNSDGSVNTVAKNAIIENIRYLHLYLLNENLPATDIEIQTTYQLWLNTWKKGQALIAQDPIYRKLACPVIYNPVTGATLSSTEKVLLDPNYVTQSWMMVVAYLLSDYRFYYE